MIAAGFITALFTGNAADMTDSMINGCSQAVKLSVELAGAYMLWSGLMGAAREVGAVDALARIMRKPLRSLFPKAEQACAPIALNLAANFFGMGGAAQPFGIEAMKLMQSTNPDKTTATDEMCMFIALNASAIDLLPMTVLALRTTAGSADPYSVAVPTFIASVAAFASAVIFCKAAERKCS